jgi:hypothetical protein
MKSLSGWQRLGIFLSVIWFLVVLPMQTRVEWAAAEARYWTCHNIDASRFSEEECREAAKIRWGPIFLAATVPIPIFWLTGWIVLSVSRWVRRRFQGERP